MAFNASDLRISETTGILINKLYELQELYADLYSAIIENNLEKTEIAQMLNKSFTDFGRAVYLAIGTSISDNISQASPTEI